MSQSDMGRKKKLYKELPSEFESKGIKCLEGNSFLLIGKLDYFSPEEGPEHKKQRLE